MKEKMTSGEIAKQAGVLTKALRVYDEKGLLKPVELTEGKNKREEVFKDHSTLSFIIPA
ncbi:MerR family DNA-binding transcriptional regulator [Butyrivibrio fibrisolvens]|uniref:MerR family DNA-binding transcriptional regulator n=1 Tax=Butyrivibrio fibrisolvens TaxID=831 RepID=UPI0003B3ECC6|nr:MerR family DNA-binding transcriptional regulator [Butyrivibrio fibrisolvens]